MANDPNNSTQAMMLRLMSLSEDEQDDILHEILLGRGPDRISMSMLIEEIPWLFSVHCEGSTKLIENLLTEINCSRALLSSDQIDAIRDHCLNHLQSIVGCEYEYNVYDMLLGPLANDRVIAHVASKCRSLPVQSRAHIAYCARMGVVTQCISQDSPAIKGLADLLNEDPNAGIRSYAEMIARLTRPPGC